MQSGHRYQITIYIRSKGGNAIKRPILWVAGILFTAFFILRLFYGKQLDKQYYSMDSLFENSLDAVLWGTLDHIDTKPNSFYYFLKNVSVQPQNKEQTFFFSNFLVVVNNEVKIEDFRQIPQTTNSVNHTHSPVTGNLIKITGTIYSFQSPTNPGQFDEKNYYKEQNIYYKMAASAVSIKNHKTNHWKHALFTLRDSLFDVYQSCMDEKNAGIISAMLLGEQSMLNADIKSLYQVNGIGHILAISGLHITILCTFFSQFLLFLRLPRPMPLLLTIIFLGSYGTMTGFRISTSRAVLMMLFFLIGKEIGRSYDAITALAVSAVITMLQKPYAICSGSFLLSYSAVLGSILTYPALKCFIFGIKKEQQERHRRQKRRFKEKQVNSRFPNISPFIWRLSQKLLSSLLFSSAVWLTTLPVVLYFFYEIPTYGILLNLFILPMVSVVVVLSLLGGITGLFFLPLGAFFLSFTEKILISYEFLCHLCLKLPNPIQILGSPKPVQIILYGILLGILIYYWTQAYYQSKKPPYFCRILSLVLFFIAMFFLLYRKPPDKLCITMLDVGQGDGIFLQTIDRKTILIDGGSSSVSNVGTYRILPFLKYYGISRIDYMIMTHSDEDHISGQLELIEGCQTNGLTIGCYLMPCPAKECRGKNYEIMQAAVRDSKIPIQYLQPGNLLQTGALKLLCLHPEKGFISDSVNAYSTVLSLSYGSFRMLFTGDLEKNGEDTVCKILSEQYDVLKVAHHGSKNSTKEEFLACISPKVSLISCGKNNWYGHPHAELLARLKDCQSRIFQTAQGGAIEILSDGKNFTVSSYCTNE